FYFMHICIQFMKDTLTPVRAGEILSCLFPPQLHGAYLMNMDPKRVITLSCISLMISMI
uniref:Uncharacterized protein n=1 Tax=Gopherus agassizii TaxID=38772 RepID=A0A452HFM4_9SAUR